MRLQIWCESIPPAILIGNSWAVEVKDPVTPRVAAVGWIRAATKATAWQVEVGLCV